MYSSDLQSREKEIKIKITEINGADASKKIPKLNNKKPYTKFLFSFTKYFSFRKLIINGLSFYVQI